MKKLFLAVSVALFATALTLTDVKAIDVTPQAASVTCRCSNFIGRECRADQRGNTCASFSENGYCQTYNSNCGGKNDDIQ